MKITMIVVKLLFLGALFIVSNNNIHLNNPQDIGVFYNLYGSWMHNLFDQGIYVTSYVVKFDWLPPVNQTIRINKNHNVSLISK